MTASSRPALAAFALLPVLLGLAFNTAAYELETATGPSALSAQAKPGKSPVLRPKDESKKCKKAKKVYALTKRNRYATPLDLNKDRRAVLDACR
jgi:hypothetical protein